MLGPLIMFGGFVFFGPLIMFGGFAFWTAIMFDGYALWTEAKLVFALLLYLFSWKLTPAA